MDSSHRYGGVKTYVLQDNHENLLLELEVFVLIFYCKKNGRKYHGIGIRLSLLKIVIISNNFHTLQINGHEVNNKSYIQLIFNTAHNLKKRVAANASNPLIPTVEQPGFEPRRAL
jgi:hypothetical protein